MLTITDRDLRHADREVISVEPVRIKLPRESFAQPQRYQCGWVGRVSRDDIDLFSIVEDTHEAAYSAAVLFYADLLNDRAEAESRDAERQEREAEEAVRFNPEIHFAAPKRI